MVRASTGGGEPSALLLRERCLPYGKDACLRAGAAGGAQSQGRFDKKLASRGRPRVASPGARRCRPVPIEAKLDPASKRPTGHETVRYVNMPPDTLRGVAVYLRQNIYAPGALRTVPLPVTGGVELARVAVEGHVLAGATRVEGVSELDGASIDRRG